MAALARLKENGPHCCNPLIYWHARQDLNPRPPWFVVGEVALTSWFY